MLTNITRVTRALRIIKASIPCRDAAGKLEAYTSARVLLLAIEAHLHPTYIHHIYTRGQILKADDGFAVMCGLSSLAAHPDDTPSCSDSKLDAILTSLEDPARWPSKCTVAHPDGDILSGTNDPQP